MKKSTIPNILSAIRIVIAPVFFLWLISDINTKIQAACVLFFVGALTDYFDGLLARKLNAITSWGRFIDPLADKILTTGAFVAFYFIGFMPLWMVIIIIIRDFGTTLLRVYSKSLKKPIITSYSAKLKTLLQMVIISGVLLLLFLQTIDNPVVSPEIIDSILFSQAMYFTFLLLVLITVATLIEYILKADLLKFYPSRK